MKNDLSDPLFPIPELKHQREVCSETEAVEIYTLYPRKVGRRKALKEIQQAVRRLHGGEHAGEKMETPEAILRLKRRVALFSTSDAGNRGIYTPHPSTWFSQSRYLDDPSEWEQQEAERWHHKSRTERTQ